MRGRLLVLIAALFVATGAARGQYFVWDGEYMMGISAGAVVPFSVPRPTLDASDNVKPESMKRSVSPVFAFYYGMERALRGRFDFGFSFDVSFSRERASLTYVDSTGLDAMSQKSNVIELSEEVFLAYYITEKMHISAGIGLAESLTFGRSRKHDLMDFDGSMRSEGQYASGGEYGMGGALSLQASVGVSYYFTNAFFVALKLRMRYPFLDFSSRLTGSDDYITKIPVALKPVVIVGFRW